MIRIQPTHYRKADLTPRQREVLALLAKGHTNAEIADRMDISLAGAKYHVSEVIGRLNVDSREEAVEAWREQNSIGHRFRALVAVPALKWAAAGVAAATVAVAAVIVLASLRADTPTPASAASWGPGVPISDGLRWVYLSGPPDQRAVLLGSEDDAIRQIGSPGRYSFPALSPDGKWLALVESDGGETFTHVIDTTSGEGVRVQTPFVPEGLHWAPDSQHFALRTVDGLLIADNDGNVAKTATPPGGSWEWNFAWSDDGKYLALITEGAISIFDGTGTSVASVSAKDLDLGSTVAWDTSSQQILAFSIWPQRLLTLGIDGTAMEKPLPVSGLTHWAHWYGDTVVAFISPDEILVWDAARPASDWAPLGGVDALDCREPAAAALNHDCAVFVRSDEEQARAVAGVSQQTRALWTSVEPNGEVALFYSALDSTDPASLSLLAGVFRQDGQYRAVEVPAHIPRTTEAFGRATNLQASFVLVP